MLPCWHLYWYLYWHQLLPIDVFSTSQAELISCRPQVFREPHREQVGGKQENKSLISWETYSIIWVKCGRLACDRTKYST